MTVGTSYTVRATSGSCTSAASASFSNGAMLATPATPTITTTAATCSANGSSAIANYTAGQTYTFNPTGPTVSGTGAISGMTVGTSYTVTAGVVNIAALLKEADAAEVQLPLVALTV